MTVGVVGERRAQQARGAKSRSDAPARRFESLGTVSLPATFQAWSPLTMDVNLLLGSSRRRLGRHAHHFIAHRTRGEIVNAREAFDEKPAAKAAAGLMLWPRLYMVPFAVN